MTYLRNLETFFHPKGIAVIGASTQPQKVGYAVFSNLISYGFSGNVYPVNPKTNFLLNRQCYPSLLQISDTVDLAVIVLPSRAVPAVLNECVQKKVVHIIIISAGFRETGPEGLRLEMQIGEFARTHQLNLIGPNCLGILNALTGLNASFSLGIPSKGNISIISQSGAICTSLIDWSIKEKVGFSKMVSLGNKLDLTEIDFLNYFKDDHDTQVIALYLEEIKAGAEFRKIAQEVSAQKPILVLKAGTTQSGAKAAASHTGSLAGSQRIYKEAFRQSGVIQCESLEELTDTLRIVARFPNVKSSRTCILTNAGGPGILTADAAEKAELTVPTLEVQTINTLQTKLPPAANTHNPVDVLGDADSNLYSFALRTVLTDNNIDNVICLLTPQYMTDTDSFARAITTVVSEPTSNKLVVTSFLGGESMSSATEILKENQIANFSFPERAVNAIHNVLKYNQFQQIPTPENVILTNLDKTKVNSILTRVKEEGRTNLDELEAREVLKSYGMNVPKYAIARTVEEAKSVAQQIGFPIVMKILSPDILHKTDVGGVRVGLKSEAEVEDAYELIMIRCRKYMPQAKILGVTITEFVSLKGKELIIGMSRDLNFGPTIMVGLGGIYVEILKDVVFRVVPLARQEVKQMITELRTYPLLVGVRGEKPIDLNMVEDVLLRVAQLALDFPELLELDINPLLAGEQGKGVNILDARMTIKIT